MQTKSEHIEKREQTLRRIRSFHISAGNAEAMMKGLEGARISNEQIAKILDQATAENDDRGQLKDRVSRAIREADARRPAEGLEWKGGIEPNIDAEGAQMFDRVMEVCRRNFGNKHTDTSGRLRLAICTGDRVEFRYRTAKFARIIDELRGGIIRAVIRNEFPHLGPVHICGPSGEEAA